ncbi:MAG: NifU family protein [Peptostreptococcaceae bacterium]|jgi:Fe-S cluster biogenesis protein NfuA|nr:NifU family protein [Peptostreptococcaceae bacterium]
MEAKIQATIDKVRPILQRDGGDVEFISFLDGVVKVRLQGACGNCPGATMTLKMLIEKVLKEDIPEVKEVVRV